MSTLDTPQGGEHYETFSAARNKICPRCLCYRDDGELLFGPTKVAKILGRSRAWVYRHYGSFNSMTVEQIASLIC